MSVTVQGQRGGNGSYYPIDQFLEIAQRNTVFSGVIASTWSDVTWTGEGEPQRLRGNHCTMNTFDVMGVAPLIGRGTAAVRRSGGRRAGHRPRLQVLAAAVRRRSGVLGRKLRLNDKVRTVIGVMPPRFMWRGADVYLPDVFHAGRPWKASAACISWAGSSRASRGSRRRPDCSRFWRNCSAATRTSSPSNGVSGCEPSARRSPAIFRTHCGSSSAPWDCCC